MRDISQLAVINNNLTSYHVSHTRSCVCMSVCLSVCACMCACVCTVSLATSILIYILYAYFHSSWIMSKLLLLQLMIPTVPSDCYIVAY